MRLSNARAGWCLLVSACVMLTGCGVSDQVTPAPASPSPSAAAAGEAAGRGQADCHDPERLPAGAAVSGWQLGAISFISAGTGVALTAPQVPCPGPLGSSVLQRAQPARLAVSGNGGRSWSVQGAAIASEAQSAVRQQLVAASTRNVWALSSSGELLATTNGGREWTPQAVPRPAVALARAGRWLWVLSCPRASGAQCRPVLERMLLPSGRWQQLPLPRLSATLDPQLALLSARAAVVQVSPYGRLSGILVSTGDAGRTWTVRAAPAGPSRLCTADSGFTTAASAWWLLCTGGAAAGSSTKALLRSTDGGRAWTTLSAVTSLDASPRPGSLATGDVQAIAAGSPAVLWLATISGVEQSTDAGVRWRPVRGIDPQGALATFDLRSATLAWLLAPGAGLWRTTDGTRWQPLAAPRAQSSSAPG
jgi:photosystem II stability/assembly factor-like uncharacterized protein